MKTTTAVILALASSAVAQWGQSCVNETINAADDVLSARCNVGDGKGTFANTTLDLNTCFRYADGKIMYAKDGKFGTSCASCFTYRLPDEIWGKFGVKRPWMNCTCSGVTPEVAVNLGQSELFALNLIGHFEQEPSLE